MAKILVITHQLSHTGAPIVLLDMMKILKEDGHEMEMISLLDGSLRPEVEALGVSIRIQDRFLNQIDDFLIRIEKVDFVIVNTLLGYEAIHLLKYTKKPVFWWLHEGEHFFEYFKTVVPDLKNLPQNIRVYSVSSYVQKVVQRRYDLWTPILFFGVHDLKSEIESEQGERPGLSFENWDPGHKKVRYLTIGVYGEVKGQDFAVQTIISLSEEQRRDGLFVFCGEEEEGKVDPRIFGSVKEAADSFSEVKHIPRQEHRDLLQLMREIDYLLVPSRMEPFSAVACEAMMLERPVILSDVCGVADVLENEKNAFLFPSEQVEALKETLVRSMKQRRDEKAYRDMCTKARKVYEKEFAYAVFRPRVEAIVEELLNCQ